MIYDQLTHCLEVNEQKNNDPRNFVDNLQIFFILTVGFLVNMMSYSYLVFIVKREI